jgi:hypothetical protein
MRMDILSLWRRRLARRERELAEDALKHLLGLEHQGRRASFQSLAGALRLSDHRLMALAGHLERKGLVRTRGQDFLLTPDGERRVHSSSTSSFTSTRRARPIRSKHGRGMKSICLRRIRQECSHG